MVSSPSLKQTVLLFLTFSMIWSFTTSSGITIQNPSIYISDIAQNSFNLDAITNDTDIDGNGELANASSGGDGSENDPYILEFSLSSSGTVHVSISNTNVFMKITNSVIENGAIGILLQNVHNATVENSTISGNEDGLLVYNSTNIIIFNNTVTSNGGLGIDFQSSLQ